MTNQYFISKAELKRLESIKLQNSYDVVFNIMAKSLTGKQERVQKQSILLFS